MTGRAPRIFVVATEESGDRLGAGLMRALRVLYPEGVGFSGVGGDAMVGEGLSSLFPAREIAIVGFVEIAKRLRFLKKSIRQVAEAALRDHPDIVVIIDSPDFTHRVARLIRQAAPHLPIIDYVSPTVWAWRPGRAKAMRAYVDHVLALLPFETDVHRRLGGPPCTYVGHPLLSEIDTLRPDAQEAARRLADPPRILVLPGSRRSEIRRLMPVFGETLARIAAVHGALDVVLPTLPHLEAMVREAAAGWSLPPRIVVGEDARRAAFRTARAALVKSGTVTLELAIAGVPMVAAYKVSSVEAAIARHIIKLPSVILANLVLGRNAVPEFLQDWCRPELLAPALAPLIDQGAARAAQIAAFAEIDAIMASGDVAPSMRAAQVVQTMIENKIPGR